MTTATLVRNLAQLATPIGPAPRRGAATGELQVVENAAILIRDGRFEFAGAEKDLPRAFRVDEEIDAGRATALPGFVDGHTHIAFAGTRESELSRRLSGESYSEIAASGGGIASTVRTTRAASREDLIAAILRRTRVMAAHGTTTAEVKSGYGLTIEHELEHLRAIRTAAATSPVRLVPTCLAAHSFPPESGREEYLDLIVSEIFPAVARERLATFCDVFVEQGFFSASEGRRVLSAGARHGLIGRVHADELSDTGGAALAVELGCASADHLMYVSDDGIRALARSETVANLLPATSFFLMSNCYAPARKLIEAGAIVALSTDCNPGTSMTESMPVVIQLACLQMKLTVEEAITAATLNSAASLLLAGEVGSIEPGKRADLVLLDAPNYLHLVYHFGVNLIRSVLIGGKVVSSQ